jgi:signal transduction histidine kinase
MKLRTKYFLAFAGVATSACLAIGIVQAVAEYRSNVAHAGELQRAEERVVATRIASYLETIAMQLDDVDALPWSSGLLDRNDRRDELHRLLKLNPAIYELRFVTPAGRERDFVSRIDVDRESAERPWPLAASYLREGRPPLWYGPVYFREGSTPYVSIAVRSPQASDALVAEVSLRYVTDLIASIRIGANGRAYVVDSANRLVAHPNLSLVHRKMSLEGLPQVASARAAGGLAAGVTQTAQSLETSADVLTSSALIDAPRWLIFVEQPLDEVMAPVRASIYRTAALLAVLLVVGVLVSRYVAVRLTRPIIDLEKGASRIAAGDLAVRVSDGGDDEIHSLAVEFNRMAENLGRSYSELEDKVRMRTRDLADAAATVRVQAQEVNSLNEQLQSRLAEVAAKKDEAERANTAKTRFLAAASHDLRQPLQAVSLLVEVLRSRIFDPEASALADKVQASVQALEMLFVSLLDISRLDAGAINPNVQQFRIASLLHLIEVNFLPQAIAKGLKLSVIHSSAVVRSDPALLERVLSNLVSNAIRYTSRGRVVVGCRPRSDCLRILVTDTGPGIPSRFQQDIFEEFFQLANPERDRSQGLGLGLSIVKRTAAILDHPLIVESEVNRGSTFGIEVPRVASALNASAVNRFSRTNPTRFSNTFVLVIDDDKASRFAIEALCRQWGCHVVSAASAGAALNMLEEHLRAPELIICDYRLQGEETGPRAIDKVRRALEERIPALVVTGDTSVTSRDLGRHKEIALMFKPINAEALWREADRLLSTPSLDRS